MTPKYIYVPKNTVLNLRTPTIWLPARIIHCKQEIETDTILDSGAEGIYCNSKFVKKCNIPTYPLISPLYPQNANGTFNKQGLIRYATILRMEMGKHHTEYMEMAITDIGNHDIILGTDWLKAHNPSINWTGHKLLFD